MDFCTRKKVISTLIRIRKRLIYFESLVTQAQSNHVLSHTIKPKTPIVGVLSVFVGHLVPPVNTNEGLTCDALMKLFYYSIQPPKIKTYTELFRFQRAFFYRHITMLASVWISVTGQVGFATTMPVIHCVVVKQPVHNIYRSWFSNSFNVQLAPKQ
jgi:hypothetical protein